MERKVHYHGYTIERTSGPRGGVYTIWDGPERRVDQGDGFNSVVEAQVYINRLDGQLPYFENDFRTALKVTQEMLDLYLEQKPENAAYFNHRAVPRFAEAVAEEIARLRQRRTGEDTDY
jgi:hypothetical protein